MINKVAIFFLLNFFLFFLGCNQELAEYEKPLLEDTSNHLVALPIAERGIEYRKFLSPSVKIKVQGASGSGTIVYYDQVKNLAYVASCGHLWSEGVVDADFAKKLNIQCTVTTWYHNEKKLNEPKSYNAKVLFYSNLIGQDTSLLVFTPDWNPEYFPIAPRNYQYNKNAFYHSCGSDGGSESAHYDVRFIGKDSFGHLATVENSPRPGRSGGGLMDDNGYYIGVCCRTQFKNGAGLGYFGSLESIHVFWGQQKGYEFLLKQKPLYGIAREIPIKDRNQKQGKYSPEYILIPN